MTDLESGKVLKLQLKGILTRASGGSSQGTLGTHSLLHDSVTTITYRGPRLKPNRERILWNALNELVKFREKSKIRGVGLGVRAR